MPQVRQQRNRKIGVAPGAVQSERAEQETLVAWADQAAAAGYPDLGYLHASLNGERLTVGQAVRAKAAGLRSGVPDLCLPVPVGAFHGLYLELKTARGALSPTQVRWHAWLAAKGFAVAVARSWGEGRDVIVSYLRGTYKNSTERK